MTLFELLAQVLKPWAFDEFGDSVYVTHGNVEFVREHLRKHGFAHVRVYRRMS